MRKESIIEHVDAVIEEVEKLEEASAVTMVFYPSLLSNTVGVKKKKGKWRMCIDFTSQSSLSQRLLSIVKN